MGTQNMEAFMEKYGFVKNKNWNGINSTVSNDSSKTDLEKNDKNVNNIVLDNITQTQISNKSLKNNKCCDDIDIFLKKLKLKQLQQIGAYLFGIYYPITKQKLMTRLMEKIVSVDDVIDSIDTEKNFS
jgi:hypothetical protein